jgi:hypothetical protein
MKRTMIIIMALVLMAGAANAQDILWDQTAGYESWSQGFFNVIGGSGPWGMSAYTCNDVIVPAGGWTMDSVKVYYDALDEGWAGTITDAWLFIEPKTGGMPTGDPTADAILVPATCTLLANNFLEVQAGTLGMVLPEGEYWVGLTPIAPTADNIHVSVAGMGGESPTFDSNGFPPGWAVWSPGLDGAMLIEGFMAVATEDVSLGSVKALYR